MNKGSELETAVQHALNDFINANDGRAPRMIELAPADWQILRDHVQMEREAEGFNINTVDRAKTGGRENFRLFGMPIVAGAVDLAGPQGVAE